MLDKFQSEELNKEILALDLSLYSAYSFTVLIRLAMIYATKVTLEQIKRFLFSWLLMLYDLM